MGAAEWRPGRENPRAWAKQWRPGGKRTVRWCECFYRPGSRRIVVSRFGNLDHRSNVVKAARGPARKDVRRAAAPDMFKNRSQSSSTFGHCPRLCPLLPLLSPLMFLLLRFFSTVPAPPIICGRGIATVASPRRRPHRHPHDLLYHRRPHHLPTKKNLNST
jgi:hypothetical protein